jgi:hypothetical protein
MSTFDLCVTYVERRPTKVISGIDEIWFLI